MKAVLHLTVWLACVLPVAAQERPEGLLWNRTGLAATLPLLVKTDEGSDYLLTLRPPGSREEVFAAYIRGGAFFRVLVPPGRYTLAFASGTEWHGPEALFGPDTELFALDTPLTFNVTVARREGHNVGLRGTGDASVTGYAVCQTIEIAPRELLTQEDFDPEALRERRLEPQARDFDLRDRFCD